MRVLIVEDNAPIRDALEKGLRDAGFAVDVAADGDAGICRAEVNDYDVIILDLMLPGRSGLSILEQLRERKADVHVLILTARSAVEDRIVALDLGADDYLIKPFVFGELLARVRALVRRKYGEKSPTVQVADLELNTSSREVFRGGRKIELTAREYALLEFMVLRTGQVVTRSDVQEHVYDFRSERESNSNVIDVYVSYLRKKIECEGSPKLIHTRRGYGYVLKEPS